MMDSPITVLCVDDSETFLELVKHYLEKNLNDICIDTVTSSKQALELLERRMYNVVIADYLMPEMDGLELLEELRMRDNHTPFIVLTGKGQEETIIQAINLGADYYVSKSREAGVMFKELGHFIGKAAEKNREREKRKQVEKSLKESENHYRRIVETAFEGIWVLDAEGRTVFVNNRMSELLGFTSEEMLNKSLYDFMDEEWKDYARSLWVHRKQSKAEQHEFRFRQKNNKDLWAIVSVTPIYDTEGQFEGLLGMVTDITERKMVEEEVRKTKKILQMTFESLDNAVFILDASDPPVIIDCNITANDIFGYGKQEMLGKSTEFLHVNKKALKTFQNVLYPTVKEKGHLMQFGFEMKRKNGEVFPTEHFVGPLVAEGGELAGWVSIVRDITERKQTEKALRDSEEKYRSIAESAMVGIAIVGEKRLQYVNETLAGMLGYTREEMESWSETDIINVIHPAERDFVMDQLRRKQFGVKDGIVPHYLCRLITKTNEMKWAELYSKTINYGESTADFIILVDITERKIIEEKLRRSEEKLRNFISQSYDGIVLSDEQGNIAEWNRSIEQISGLTYDDVIGQPLWHIHLQLLPTERKSQEILAAAKSSIMRMHETGESPWGRHIGEIKIEHKDGTQRIVQQVSFPIRTDRGFMVGSIIRDITGSKFARETLEKQTRELTERLKELDCLYSVSKLLLMEKDEPIDTLFQKIVNLMPEGYQFPADTCARLVYQDSEFKTANYQLTQGIQVADIMIAGEKVGWLEMCRFSETASESGSLFLEEEQELINTIAREIALYLMRKQAENDLMESENRYRTLFENVPIGLYRTTPDGRIIAANPAFAEIMGIKLPEGDQKGVMDQFAADSGYNRDQFMRTIEQEGEVTGLETKIKRKDGTEIVIRENARAVRDMDGSVLRYEGTIENITMEVLMGQQLRAERDRVQQYLDIVGAIIIALNKKGEVTLVNRKGCSILGYREEEIVHKDWVQNFISENTKKEVAKVLNGLFTENINSDEYFESPVLTNTGEEKIIAWHITTIKSEEGAIIGILSSGEDITDRKKAEKALKETERRLKALNASLESRSSELQVLYEISKEVGFIHNYDELMTLVVKHLQRAIPADIFAALLVMDSSREFYYWSSNEISPVCLEEIKSYVLNTFSMFNKQSMDLNKVTVKFLKTSGPRSRSKPFIDSWNSHVSVPIITGEDNPVTGFFFVFDERSNAFSENHIKLLYTVINQVSDSVRRLQESFTAGEKIRKLSQAVEQSPNAIIIMDLDGVVEYVNPSTAQLTGYDIGEIVGKKSSFIESIETYAENFIELFETIIADGVWKGEYRTRNKTGDYYWENATISTIKNEDGAVTHILAIREDITGRKEAEEEVRSTRDHLAAIVAERTRDLQKERNRIKSIIELIYEGILVLDKEGQVLLANMAFKDHTLRIFQSEQPIENWISNDLPGNDFVVTIRQLFFAGEPMSKTIEAAPGLHLQLSSSVIASSIDGNPVGIIIESRDITSFVEFDSMRKRFISTVSHELRTPITAILQSISNFQKYKQRLTVSQQEHLITLIRSNAELLSQLVEDLLIISRIEEKRIQLVWKRFRLVDALNAVLNQMEVKIREKKIAMNVIANQDIFLSGDKDRISQVVRILVDNALKFSAEKTVVTIKAMDNYILEDITGTREGVLIQITDTGRGIKEEDISHLFERFFRSIDVQHIPGTGLGLSIAKELVDLHKGIILVESEYEKGSSFSFFLPRLGVPPEDD